MYPFLPGMQNISSEMLEGAFQEMIQYYKDDDDLLRDQIICFQTVLRQANRLPALELEQLERTISMYDPLIAEDPHIQEVIEQAVVHKTVANFRQTLMSVIEARFPALAKQKQEIALPDKLDALNLLIVQISSAPDERVARAMLGLPITE